MVLSGAVIAGISAASTIVAIVIILALCIAVKKRRRTAEYLERCGRLWEKYGRRSQGSDIVAKFPFADPSYIKTPVPGQQFTSQELNQGGFVLLRKQSGENDADLERRPFMSMHTPIEPETLDPRHYSYGTDQQEEIIETTDNQENHHPPQIYFSAEYDEVSNVLKVFIEQAKHLHPNNYAKVCDPYCVVSLLPGEQDKRQTQIQRNTLDPVFHESFSFHISSSELNESSLQIKVFAYDQYSHDDCIGFVQQKFEDVDLTAKVEFWRKIFPILDEKVYKKAGELLLRLGYQAAAEKLTVVLLKARGLIEVGPEDEKTSPDPYVRVAISHDGNLMKKKKTSTKKKTCNPTFNQVINFSVPLHLLPQIEIGFDVVDEDGTKLDRTKRKKIIGTLEISPHSSGEEKEHWKDLMSNKPQARWHQLVIKPVDDVSDSGGQYSSKEVATEPLLDF